MTDEVQPETKGPSRLSDKWLGNATDATPSGLRQEDQREAPLDYETGEPQGLAKRAQRWYGGANSESTRNGYDTKFYREFRDQQNAAVDKGTLATFFDQKDATGIVTYDQGRHKFGDVYENGERVGNLYDTYDESTADLILADLTLSSDVKLHAFSGGSLHKEVEGQRKITEAAVKKGASQADFEGDVDERVANMSEGVADDWAAFIAGASGGTALGATGFAAGPVVGAVTTTLGALIGGFGALLNRDELTTIAATALEKGERAGEEFEGWQGEAARLSEYVQGAGHLSYLSLQPTTNLAKGWYDEAQGSAGDGESEFYKVNENTGVLERPDWMKWVTVGTTLVDSIGLAGPASTMAFTGSMMSTITGSMGELVFTGGARFNDRSGAFESVVRDEETGNLTPGRTAAALGNIGMDAIQMFTLRGLAGSVTGVARGMGTRGAKSSMTAAQQGRIKSTLSERLIARAMPRSFTGKAVAANAKIVQTGGVLYAVDAAGVAISKKFTLSILAPSEFVGAANVALRAKLSARSAMDVVKLTDDDFYRAAMNLAAGSSARASILVNGFGEGMEEGIQAILEPAQFGETTTAGRVFDASVMGFAMGAGMSMGTSAMGVSADKQLYSQYVWGMTEQSVEGTSPSVLTYDEWSTKSQFQKSESVLLSQVDTMVSNSAAQDIKRNLEHSIVGGRPEIAKAQSAALIARDLKNGTINDSINATFVISGTGDPDMKSYATGTSHEGAIRLLSAFRTGNAEKISAVQADIAKGATPELNAELAHYLLVEEQASAIDGVMQEASSRIAEIVADLNRQTEAGNLTDGATAGRFSMADLEQFIDLTNVLLMNAFENVDGQQVLDPASGAVMDGVLSPEARLARRDAVTLLQGRHPIGYTGSFAVLVPQLDARLVRYNGHNGMLLNLAVVQAMGADFDGDKIQTMARLRFKDGGLENLRQGKQYIRADGTVNIMTRAVETTMVRHIAESIAGSNEVPQTHATQMIDNIHTTFAEMLRVKPSMLDNIFKKFEGELGASNPKSAINLIDGVMKAHSDQALQWSERTSLPVVLEFDRVIHNGYRELNNMYAVLEPNAKLSSAKTAIPVPQSGPVARVIGGRAATDGQTAGIAVEGSDMFRIFQSLKYVADASQTIISTMGSDPRVMRLQSKYRELSRQVVGDKTMEAQSRDEITNYALRLIRSFVSNGITANAKNMAVVANTAIPNVDGNGIYHGNEPGQSGYISTAQWALREALEWDKINKASVWEALPELQARHNRLRALLVSNDDSEGGFTNQSQAAFVEVFDAVQIGTLVGEEAGHLAGTTVGMFVRRFAASGAATRLSTKNSIENNPAYKGRRNTKNPPYSGTEVLNRDISPYRSTMEAVLHAGAKYINMDKDFHATGELGEMADRTHAQGLEAMGRVIGAFTEMVGVKNISRKNIEGVREMIRTNPDWAASMLGLLPDAQVSGVMSISKDAKGNNVLLVAPWVYEMFTMDPEAAMMHYWRNMMLTELNVKLSQTKNTEALQFHELDNRIHRLMYRLRREPDPAKYRKFQGELASADNLPNFIAMLNREYLNDEAPYTTWVNDASDFSPDKAKGGWSVIAGGAAQRSAIQAFATSSARLVDSIAEERETLLSDNSTLVAVQEGRDAVVKAGGFTSQTLGNDVVIEALPNSLSTDPNAREYLKWIRMFEKAKLRYFTLGPNAIMDEALGALLGFYSPAADKGQVPEHLKAIGSYLMGRANKGFKIPSAQHAEALTSSSRSSLDSNLAQVFNGGRFVTAEGALVEWAPLTADGLLARFNESPEMRVIVQNLMYPSVQDSTKNGRLVEQFIGGKTLSAQLEFSYDEFLMRHDDKSSRLYVSEINGIADRMGGDSDAMLQANEVLLVHSLSAKHEISFAEAEKRTATVIRDLARVMNVAGELNASGQDMKELYTLVLEQMGRLDNSNVTSDRKTNIKIAEDTLRVLAAQKSSALNDAIDAEFSKPAAERNLQLIQEWVDRDLKVKADAEARILNSSALDSIIRRHAYNPEKLNDQQKLAARKRLFLSAYTLPALGIRVPDVVAISATIQALDLEKLPNAIPKLNDDQWSLISRALIAYDLEQLSNSMPGSVVLAPFPKPELTERHRYYDSSYSFLLDRILDPEQPLLKAATYVAQRRGVSKTTHTVDDLARLLSNSIMNPDKLGEWSNALPKALTDANPRLGSSATEVATQAGGLESEGQVTFNVATEQTGVVPGEELLTTTELSYGNLFALREVNDQGEQEIIPFTTEVGGVQRPMRIGEFNGRYAAGATVTYSTSDGIEHTVDLWRDRPLDPADPDGQMKPARLGKEYRGTLPTVSKTPYRMISVDALRDAIFEAIPHNPSTGNLKTNLVDQGTIKIQVQYFHPDSQPATPDFANNIFFEGSVSETNSGMAPSSNGEYWAGSQGAAMTSLEHALGSGKKGVNAYEFKNLPTWENTKQMEESWATDFAEVLKLKATWLTVVDPGPGAPPPIAYNALLKKIKMQHFVRGLEEGVATLWSAEQVIQFQLTNPGTGLPLENAELVVLSEEGLNTLLGEKGFAGVNPLQAGKVFLDPTKVQKYRGVTAEMLRRLPALLETDAVGEFVKLDLFDTDLIYRRGRIQHELRSTMQSSRAATYEEAIKKMRSREDNEHNERAKQGTIEGKREVRIKRGLSLSANAFDQMRMTLDRRFINDKYSTLHNTTNEALSLLMVQELEAVQSLGEYSTWWIYEQGASETPATGVLSELVLEGRDGHTLAPGVTPVMHDNVTIRMESFAKNGRSQEEQLKDATKAIDFFMGAGARIILANSEGGKELITSLEDYITSQDTYRGVGASRYVYEPVLSQTRAQTQRALDAQLAETHSISAQDRMAVFYSETLYTDENSLHILNTTGNDVTVRVDLLPTEPYDGITSPLRSDEVAKVKQAVIALANDRGRVAEIAAQHKYSKKATAELQAAVQKAAKDYTEAPSYALARPAPRQTLTIGGLVPYWNPTTHDLVLYRHGHKPPEPHEITNMIKDQRKKNKDRPAVVVYGENTMDTAGVHTGVIEKYNEVGQYGVTAQVRISLADYFSKLVSEGSGFKTVTAPALKEWQSIDTSLFPYWDLNAIGSFQAVIDKESYGDVSMNHRNAFAFIGIDFYPEVAKTLFGIDIEKMNETDRNSAEQMVQEVLTKLTKDANYPETAIHHLLRVRSDAKAAAEEIWGTVAPIDDNLALDWTTRLFENNNPAAEITSQILLTLMTKGTRPEHLLRSGSFGNPDARTNPDKTSLMMKRLFTDSLDVTPSLGMRQHINDKLNSQLGWDADKGEGYRIDLQMRLHRIDPKTGVDQVGWLAFPEVHSADASPTLDGMADQRKQKEKHSVAVSSVASSGLGADTVLTNSKKDFDGFFGAERLLTFKDARDVNKLFTSFASEKDSSYMPWKIPSMGGQMYMKLGRKRNVGYWQPVNMSHDSWGDNDVTKEGNMTDALSQRTRVARILGLPTSDHITVDYMVRYYNGQPLDESGGDMSASDYIEGLSKIEENINNGRLPTYEGAVPRLDYHLLQTLFRANNAGYGKFQLLDAGKDSAVLTDWSKWVGAALGENSTGEGDFHPMFRLDLDAVTHTYMNAESSLSGMPISVDDLVDAKLLSKDLDKVILSISPDVQIALDERVYLESERVSFEDVLGVEFFKNELRVKTPVNSREHHRHSVWKAWSRRKELPEIKDTTPGSFSQHGVQMVNKKTALNTVSNIALSLRAFTTLANPALPISAFGEVAFHSALDNMTETLLGTSATRLGGGLNRNTAEEVRVWRAALSTLGSSEAFASMAYKQSMFQQRISENAGPVERLFGNAAKGVSKIQDPGWRMRVDALAHRYGAAVLEYLQQTPMTNAVSLPMLASKLKTDPHWVENNIPDAHRMGINAIETNRSLKSTPADMLIKGVINPLMESPNAIVSSSATLFLKVPLMFSTYASHVFTTLTGTQAPMAALAMHLHRRRNYLGRYSSAVRQEEMVDEDGYFDMTAAIESIDLAKGVVQSGLTHTSIFAFALFAGGLGLSGEDEEDKRRRRAAEYNHAGYVYDPSKIQNDFRTADAVFLDGVYLLNNFFKIPGSVGERSMAKPNWMVKQFLSPILGIEKFADTGDMRQVMWGFEDAIGAFPLINSASWEKAMLTFNELTQSAKAAETRGTPEDMSDAAYFLVSTVAAFESMLFENSFVNSLYVAMDEYDRDPWKLPQTDGEGNIVRDELGQPQETNALDQFLDADGQPAAGYVNRDWLEAQAHVLTENRASFAMMMSIFSGIAGRPNDYSRYNMAVKERDIPLQSVGEEEAEGLFLSIYDEATDSEVLNENGARAVFDGIWHRSVKMGDPSLDGIYVPRDMRKSIQDKMVAELTEEGVGQGMDIDAASNYAWEVFNGPESNPYATSLRSIVWSQEISMQPKARYQQLNTTYVMGPDGRPWATGVRRGDLFTAMGGALGAPMLSYYQGDVGNLDVDSRLNSTDDVYGINTGLRALNRVDESWDIPTDEEISEDIIKAIEDAAKDIQAGASGGYGGGGGGGGYSAKLYTPPQNRAPFAHNMPYLNANSTYTKRTYIRRERFTSQRGRLKQWQ